MIFSINVNEKYRTRERSEPQILNAFRPYVSQGQIPPHDAER